MRNTLLDLFGKPRQLALDRAKLPAFMNRYLDLVTAYTDALPGLLLTAWLPHLAVNLGNRVFMFNNAARIYPNIWATLIGPSSVSRKSTALRYAGYTIAPYQDALDHAPDDEFQQQTQILNNITLSMLLSYLAQNPNRLFVQNEISGWLADMGKTYNASFKQVITELFDGVDRSCVNRERTERIRRPALSIAAASTAEWMFRDLMSSADQLGGFLQRFIYFVVQDIDPATMNLDTVSAQDLEARLGVFETEYFQWWRGLGGPIQLDLSEAAIALRGQVYPDLYRAQLERKNDTLMSYFTRVYDGYWYKFATIIQLASDPTGLAEAVREGWPADFIDAHPVTAQTAEQAFYLCDFYFANTMPLLQMLDEQDKLAGERKLIDLLVKKFRGKAKRMDLMNLSHMRKREFNEVIETLIERGAIRVETYAVPNKVSGKMYVIDPELMDSWESSPSRGMNGKKKTDR